MSEPKPFDGCIVIVPSATDPTAFLAAYNGRRIVGLGHSPDSTYRAGEIVELVADRLGVPPPAADHTACKKAWKEAIDQRDELVREVARLKAELAKSRDDTAAVVRTAREWWAVSDRAKKLEALVAAVRRCDLDVVEQLVRMAGHCVQGDRVQHAASALEALDSPAPAEKPDFAKFDAECGVKARLMADAWLESDMRHCEWSAYTDARPNEKRDAKEGELWDRKLAADLRFMASSKVYRAAVIAREAAEKQEKSR